MVQLYDDRLEISNPGGLLPYVAEDFFTTTLWKKKPVSTEQTDRGSVESSVKTY